METTFENPAQTIERERKIRELDAHYCQVQAAMDAVVAGLVADIATLDSEIGDNDDE